jgi:hypothetical protein
VWVWVLGFRCGAWFGLECVCVCVCMCLCVCLCLRECVGASVCASVFVAPRRWFCTQTFFLTFSVCVCVRVCVLRFFVCVYCFLQTVSAVYAAACPGLNEGESFQVGREGGGGG